MRVAFIGLGVMGAPMAGHLAAEGHTVSVYNRSPEKARLWAEQHPGAAATTPAEAAQGAELVALCVGNDTDVRGLVPQILPALAPGALLVDHTTTSAELARDMAALAAASGHSFLDAPVSGGQAGAQAGRLTVMCGGDPAAFARAEPVLASYGRAIRLMGGPGAGQLTKMVNQIAIAGVVQG
ncbi:MAG: NAD(P)-dependent oxidoreductase, partial [Phenylobacterium sp.]